MLYLSKNWQLIIIQILISLKMGCVNGKPSTIIIKKQDQKVDNQQKVHPIQQSIESTNLRLKKRPSKPVQKLNQIFETSMKREVSNYHSNQSNISQSSVNIDPSCMKSSRKQRDQVIQNSKQDSVYNSFAVIPPSQAIRSSTMKRINDNPENMFQDIRISGLFKRTKSKSGQSELQPSKPFEHSDSEHYTLQTQVKCQKNANNSDDQSRKRKNDH